MVCGIVDTETIKPNSARPLHVDHLTREFYALDFPNFKLRAKKDSDNCILQLRNNSIEILRISRFKQQNENIIEAYAQRFIIKQSLQKLEITEKLNMFVGTFEENFEWFCLGSPITKMCCLSYNLESNLYVVLPLVHI